MSNFIVVAEDEEETRIRITRELTNAGYAVCPCADGREALAAIEKLIADGHRPLVLTDWNMPEMDGLELLQALHNKGWRLSTVIMSGYPQNAIEPELKGASLELDGFIDKPFLSDFPLDIVQHAFARHQMPETSTILHMPPNAKASPLVGI